MPRFVTLLLVPFLLLGAPGNSQTASQTNGSDLFVSGSGGTQTVAAERDLFASGPSIVVKGQIGGDAHVAGFDIDVEAPTGADLYAAGASVTIRNSVGEDLSAMGFSLRTTAQAVVHGNARLAGNTVTIEGPVGGALTVAGNQIVLNARIGGDAMIMGQDISFGPDAVIVGNLTYAATAPITVPEQVITPDRITYRELERSEMAEEIRVQWERTKYPVLPGVASVVAAALISLAFLVIVGALFASFMPEASERMRASIVARPGAIFLSGIIGLSILFGLVPVSGMTLVGLPFIPIILLVAVAVWTLGYVLAVYAVALRIWQGLGGPQDPSRLAQLGCLAVGIIVVAMLNFIPFIGWVANFTLALLGIGAITSALFERYTGGAGAERNVAKKPAKPAAG